MTASYQWDPLNRLTKQVTSETGGAHYTYRADGMRTQKVTDCSYSWYYDEINDSSFYDEVKTVHKPTTRYFYDGQMACEEDFAEIVPNEDPFFEVTRYGLGALGIDWIEKATVEDTSISFPIYDGHGNVIAQLGRTGSSYSLTQVKKYDVWGGVRSGALGPAGRYCGNLGHVSDDESGLIYMRARYYESGSGRFVSEDPARDGLNWYAYCGNDPVQKVDPTGKFGIFGGGLMAIGAVLALLSWGSCVLENMSLAIAAAQMSVGIFKLAFTAEHVLGDDDGAEVATPVKAITLLMNGGGFLAKQAIKRFGASPWLNGVLGAAANGCRTGGGGLASIALAGTYVYTLVLCGALVALDSGD